MQIRYVRNDKLSFKKRLLMFMEILRINYYSLICILFLCCNSERSYNLDETEDINNKSADSSELIRVFLSNDLSSLYLTNPFWKEELFAERQSNYFDNGTYITLREIHIHSGQGIPYRIITYKNANYSYIFPFLDEYYYHYSSKFTNYYLLKRSVNHDEVSKMIKYFLLSNISLDKHLNFIFSTDSLYSNFNITNYEKVFAVTSLIDTILVEYQNMSNLDLKLSADTILGEIDYFLAEMDSNLLNKKIFISNIKDLNNPTFINKDTLVKFYKYNLSIFKVKIYEDNNRPKIESTLINNDLFFTFFW